MPANQSPIYTKQPVNSADGTSTSTSVMAPTLTLAANDYTGISANNVRVFTADAANGSRCPAIGFKSLGTNVQTVARVYINNGGVNTTAANNTFIGEFQLPATTISATVASPDLAYALPVPNLAPGFRVFVGLSTAVAAGWDAFPIEAGRY